MAKDSVKVNVEVEEVNVTENGVLLVYNDKKEIISRVEVEAGCKPWNSNKMVFVTEEEEESVKQSKKLKDK